MEIAKLVLEYLKILVWPSVILTIVLIFRRQIESLIERLQKADLPGGVSISLSAEIREARKLSEQVSAEAPSPKAKGAKSLPLTEANLRMLNLGLQPSPSGLNIDYYRDIAISNPNLALSGLSLEVNVIARNLAKGFNVNVKPQESGEELVRKLLDSGAITDKQAGLILKILELANAGVRGSVVMRDEADQIISIAGVLVAQYISWLSWGFDDGWKPKTTN
ncbi:MAG: hypothetical protein F6K10_22180 [Moorea sp. SIO2B7]|nr:hypothetical protein [Moorena sp. SIO2B7]